MKSKKGLRFALILAACAVMLLQGCSQEEKEMEGKVKIISYNVLVEWCTEYNGANTGVTKTYDLTSRLADLSELLKKEKPDSFGVQECSYAIKQHLLRNLTNYGCVGVMDTGGAGRRERLWDLYLLQQREIQCCRNGKFLAFHNAGSGFYISRRRPSAERLLGNF